MARRRGGAKERRERREIERDIAERISEIRYWINKGETSRSEVEIDDDREGGPSG